MKLDLRGRGKPKNAGAWRLAWHIAEAHGGDVMVAAIDLGTQPMVIDRLLDGEVSPGDVLCGRLWADSSGTIFKSDFQKPVSVRWYDRPYARRRRMLAA